MYWQPMAHAKETLHSESDQLTESIKKKSDQQEHPYPQDDMMVYKGKLVISKMEGCKPPCPRELQKKAGLSTQSVKQIKHP